MVPGDELAASDGLLSLAGVCPSAVAGDGCGDITPWEVRYLLGTVTNSPRFGGGTVPPSSPCNKIGSQSSVALRCSKKDMSTSE